MRKLCVAILPIFVLTGCATNPFLTRSAVNPAFAEAADPPGRVFTGPWDIRVPTNWFMSAVDFEGQQSAVVWGGDASTGVSFRVEQLSESNPADLESLMQTLVATRDDAMEVTLDTRSYPEPVLRIETAGSVAWTTILQRGLVREQVSIAGPSESAVETAVSMTGPEFLFYATVADHAVTEGRLRHSPPHLYDPTGTWRWISDLESGLLAEAALETGPIMVAITNIGDQGAYVHDTSSGSGSLLIWTGVRLYAVKDTGEDPMSVLLQPVLAGYDTFTMTLHACPDCETTARAELHEARSPLRTLLEHVIILDNEKAPQ